MTEGDPNCENDADTSKLKAAVVAFSGISIPRESVRDGLAHIKTLLDFQESFEVEITSARNAVVDTRHPFHKSFKVFPLGIAALARVNKSAG
eukprot:2183290-Pyramimonas_sp.AAC.1